MIMDEIKDYITLMLVNDGGPEPLAAGQPMKLTAAQAEPLLACQAICLASAHRAPRAAVDLVGELSAAQARIAQQEEMLVEAGAAISRMRDAMEQVRSDHFEAQHANTLAVAQADAALQAARAQVEALGLELAALKAAPAVVAAAPTPAKPGKK